MTVVNVFWVQPTPRSAGSWMLRFDFDLALLSTFKADFPFGRVWNPMLRVWMLERHYTRRRIALWANSQGCEVIWDASCSQAPQAGSEPEPEPRRPPRASQSTNSAYHDMLASLPPEVLKKVYRFIAGEIHPDRGGSERIMQEVNAAWDRIKK